MLEVLFWQGNEHNVNGQGALHLATIIKHTYSNFLYKIWALVYLPACVSVFRGEQINFGVTLICLPCFSLQPFMGYISSAMGLEILRFWCLSCLILTLELIASILHSE